MSKRIQARRQKPLPPVSTPQINEELLESLQKTIQELQTEVIRLKARVTEEQVARRDQLLMESLREIRERKQKGLWNRVVKFAINRH